MDDQTELPGMGHNAPPEETQAVAVAGLDQTAAGPLDARPEDQTRPAPALSPDEELIDPALLDQCRAKAREFSTTAKAWADVREIESSSQSALLTDFIAGARGVFKVVDGLRKDAKRPYDEKADRIQAYFAKILAEVTKSVERVKPLQEAWLKKENDRIAKERAEQARIAQEDKEKAEADLLAAQARGDIGAEVEAEAKAKGATKAEKVAARPVRAAAGSASGAGKAMGLRRSIVAELSNPRLALMHFAGNPALTECLINLALAEARAAGVDEVAKGFGVPGFNLSIKESV